MAIEENLRKIQEARYGREVRGAIHDAIHECYEDGRAGATDLIAREQIAAERTARETAVAGAMSAITAEQAARAAAVTAEENARTAAVTAEQAAREAAVANLESIKADKTQLASPFNFKGSCLFAELPTSGNEVNDTYYVTDMTSRYSWNGTAWYQSGMSEADYTDALAAVETAVQNLEDGAPGTITGELKEEIEQVSDELKSIVKSNNVFIAATSKNNTAMASADGAESVNTNFWVTDFIDVEGKSKIYSSATMYKVLFFKTDRTVISEGSRNTNVQNIVANCKYVRIQYQQVIVPYSSVNDVYIGFKALMEYNLAENVKVSPYSLEEYEHTYYGEPIKLRNSYDYKSMGTMYGNQSGCVYGKYLLRMNIDDSFYLYNIETATRLGKYPLGGGLKPHCNTACFGKKYADTDPFPLLYINAYNTVGLPKGTCYVHRILGDFTNGFSTQLIQTITIGFTEDSIWKSGNDVRPYGNFCVDIVHRRLYVYTLRDADKKTRFFEFVLPNENTENVILNTTDIVDTWDCPYYPYIQDNCYCNGKLILCTGGLSGEYGYIRFIDLVTHKEVSRIVLNEGGITIEPEAIDIYDNKLFFGQELMWLFRFN